ncbi:hypothetical protein T492DRAFT_985856 [Pavlovales sp. CCMP2436]|nr:hypothetical protein T492DRAFT_985856 [Pavlovales sp. CCMP2436]
MVDFSNRKARKPYADDEGESFYRSESESQQLLMQEQDQTLHSLQGGINRMGQMALTINEELDTQNRMIEELDEHIDKTESSISSLHKKLKVLASGSDSGKYCTICFLSVVLIVLFWLIINDE